MSSQRRFKSAGSRWGPGVVHRYIYSRENRVWYVACRSPYKDPHGSEVDSKTEVTCTRCGGNP